MGSGREADEAERQGVKEARMDRIKLGEAKFSEVFLTFLG